MPDLLVVIPTYNESGGITRIIERTRAAAPDADILVVDDASPDGTGAMADDIAARDSTVTVLHRPTKDGLGQAYLAGFAVARDRGYEFVAEMDADGSHDPAELAAMLALARSGTDLVIGSRLVPGGRVENWPWYRRTVSRLGNDYARFVLGSKVRDLTAGFRVYRRATLETVTANAVASQGYCFQVELAWRLERSGATIVEHPITFIERETGRSKMHPIIIIEALLRVTGWGLARPFTSSVEGRTPFRP